LFDFTDVLTRTACSIVDSDNDKFTESVCGDYCAPYYAISSGLVDVAQPRHYSGQRMLAQAEQ